MNTRIPFIRANRSIILNYVSVALVAVFTLLMNAVIIFFYDSSVLGNFNEAYAWYMILSQISVFGINMSVLKYVPEQQEAEKKDSYLLTGVIIVLGISLIVVLAAETVLLVIPAYEWKRSVQVALLGLSLFSVNKVLLNFLNARYHFVAYAVFQSFRFFMLFFVTALLSAMRVDSSSITWTFLISEAITCAVIMLYILTRLGFHGAYNRKLCREILAFGIRIFPSNMVVEMNTKLDMVCLGFLLVDSASIGIYSFAVQFADGFFTLYFTIRKLINPGISEANKNSGIKDYFNKIDKTIKKYNLFASTVALVLVVCCYYLICYLMGRETYYIGAVYLFIICVSMAMTGRAIIWGDILGQTGYPLDESKGNILTALSNVICNIVFILFFSAYGAAIATGISHFVYAIVQKKLVKKRLGISM